MPLRDEYEAGPGTEDYSTAEEFPGEVTFPVQRTTCRLSRAVLGLSPDRLLVVLVVLIVIAEGACVALHLLLKEIPLALEVALETTILLTLLVPPYFFIYRPFWLERLHREKEIRLFSRQLIRAEEKSRKTLARDLHDEFGQVLTALQFGVETICNSLTADQQHMAANCGRLSAMIAQLGNHVRDVTAELRPTMLDSIGLVPALRWHAKQFETMHAGIKVVVRAEDAAERLPPEVEIAIYRVCQESLNNVVKHARARKVRIDLRRAPDLLTLSVRDDGVGFAEDRWRAPFASPSGFGILGMRERIADLGGLFEVVSRPGKGTDVRVRLPLAGGEEDR